MVCGIVLIVLSVMVLQDCGDVRHVTKWTGRRGVALPRDALNPCHCCNPNCLRETTNFLPDYTMTAYAIDQASLDLILELQLHDVERLLKGKHREDEIPDAEVAAELYKAEIESALHFYSDQALCRSIANAVLTDGNVIKEHVDAELQATQDRHDAQNWDHEDRPQHVATEQAALEDEMLRKLEILYIGGQDSVDDAQCSSDALDLTPRATTEHQRRDCVACRMDVLFFDTLRCPCSHDYCRECIASLFEASISDETLFPPRCYGQTIPLGVNQIFLPATLVGQYRAKELEYNTPNRTYYHSPDCSTFIPPPFIHNEIATCTRCERKTYILCKTA